MSFLRWARMACAALTLLATGAARAASIEVAPVIVELAPNRLFATLTVSNHADDTTAVQLRSFAWSQGGDDEKLDPTGDMIVSPPIFQLGPHETQTVRVLLRKAPQPGRQISYRILLDELPSAGEPGKVQFALRLSMPVFATSPDAPPAALSWRIVNAPGGAELRVTNTGGRFERVSDVVVTLPDGRSIKGSLLHNPYVLPGVERHIPLHVAHVGTGGAASVAAKDDNGPLKAAADIQDGP